MDRTETPPIPDTFTTEYFDSFEDIQQLPVAYTRKPAERIYVTRDLNMNSVKYIGFDMDYTLAVYNSPLFESITYDLSIKRLIELGYPEEIATFKYDPSFPIRGLFVDTLLGNFLKVDGFGFIYKVVHGRTVYSTAQRKEIYPSAQVPSSEIGKRFFMMNTLFNLVDACLFSDLVVYYEKKAGNDLDDPNLSKSGIYDQQVDISFINLFTDIRLAVDYVHVGGLLKQTTLDRIEELVTRTPQLSNLLHGLQKAGKKTFLLTNSQFEYTNKLMTYMLSGFNENYPDWKDYFDFIIVGANKPAFFGDGVTLREVNLETGSLNVRRITEFEKGHVYNGGSMKVFSQLSGAQGTEVLYVGDHIFSDVIVSKKRHKWRNLLVIRELEQELHNSRDQKAEELLKHLQNMNFVFREIYKNMDATSTNKPDISLLRKHIKKTVSHFESLSNEYFGPLFRSGGKHSFFAMQTQRYADLYTSDYSNLLNYPPFYYFAGKITPMPHESTELREIQMA